MIKAEMVFNENKMFCNGWLINEMDMQWDDNGARYQASTSGRDEYFQTLEHAVKYCMEN